MANIKLSAEASPVIVASSSYAEPLVEITYPEVTVEAKTNVAISIEVEVGL
jgi:hypothetical protein